MDFAPDLCLAGITEDLMWTQDLLSYQVVTVCPSASPPRWCQRRPSEKLELSLPSKASWCLPSLQWRPHRERKQDVLLSKGGSVGNLDVHLHPAGARQPPLSHRVVSEEVYKPKFKWNTESPNIIFKKPWIHWQLPGILKKQKNNIFNEKITYVNMEMTCTLDLSDKDFKAIIIKMF